MRRLIALALFVPTLLWNLLLARVLRVRHWWDRIDDHVLMGALPFSWDVPKMKQEGVGAVVNTCSEYAGPQQAYDEADIVQLRLPTVDFTAPSLADVERGVAFMDEQIVQGRDVYVHCKAGATQCDDRPLLANRREGDNPGGRAEVDSGKASSCSPTSR